MKNTNSLPEWRSDLSIVVLSKTDLSRSTWAVQHLAPISACFLPYRTAGRWLEGLLVKEHFLINQGQPRWLINIVIGLLVIQLLIAAGWRVKVIDLID